MMYLKFGFGRATQDAGIEIRRGAMTRSQGLNLVKMYDNYFPKNFIRNLHKPSHGGTSAIFARIE